MKPTAQRTAHFLLDGSLPVGPEVEPKAFAQLWSFNQKHDGGDKELPETADSF